MSIAITDDHKALADTAREFLIRSGSLAASRALLDGSDNSLPVFWTDMAEIGWMGLHISESDGGSGFGMPELVVVVEQMGAFLTPGPFVTTVVASSVINSSDDPELRALLRGLADGSTVGSIAVSGRADVTDDLLSGNGLVALGADVADILLIPVSEDVYVVERSSAGLEISTHPNMDPTRPAVRVDLNGVPAKRIPGGAQTLCEYSRLLFSAEAVGIARSCVSSAATYAKDRVQFGRPIATFQAVKHHCANMLVEAELATVAVWDAARAAKSGGEQFSYTSAIAAALALPAADHNAQLNIQVHGGIGFTWEHDAHLYLRRATAIEAAVSVKSAYEDLASLVRSGVERRSSVDLPPAAEVFRTQVREVIESVAGLSNGERRERLLETGYLMPHWPKPWGRDATAVEQLVIEQEFSAAGLSRPAYSITGWVILTLIQHGTADQVERWVRPALNEEVIWCQLFSEPDAGSDAAGVKTRATRVDGGWRVNGQKVWTSGAHVAGFGLATVRTDPNVAKHQGITTMVIDMHAEGVEVRPLRMPSGGSEFNEVFFDDVFVPDDDVVGPVNGGWTVARATLGNESVSIGGGQGGLALPASMFIGPFDSHPDRLTGGETRLGRHIARTEAVNALNVRSAHRAVAGAEPGAEGAVTKLVLSENGHEASAILRELGGSDLLFMDGPAAMAGMLVLMHRAMSIAGGTSEIKRNQIGERLLGLPRDPLIH